MPGRPTKLTPDRAERIVALIRAGAYAHTAAQTNGIHKATYHEWVARGRDANRHPHTGMCVNPNDQPYADFHDAVKDAEAAAEVAAIAQVRAAAAQGTWQAAAWYLERKYPDRWGRVDRSKVEITAGQGDGGESVDAEAVALAFLAEREQALGLADDLALPSAAIVVGELVPSGGPRGQAEAVSPRSR